MVLPPGRTSATRGAGSPYVMAPTQFSRVPVTDEELSDLETMRNVLPIF